MKEIIRHAFRQSRIHPRTPPPAWAAIVICVLIVAACSPQAPATESPGEVPVSLPIPSSTPAPTPTLFPTAAPARSVPDFEHIAMIVFENKEFGSVIGSLKSPYFNVLAGSNTLLTQQYATTHPSLPNYLSMIGGDTFGITEDCEDCFINAPSLPDLIEASGRTWKTYQEDMPAPCYAGSTVVYVQKHNPFMYFDPIRLDAARCGRSVVPFTQLEEDIAAQSIPNFVFITPNLCHSAHSCSLPEADAWLDTLLDRLVPALGADGKPYLIIVTWDEGQNDLGCCGLPEPAGGRIATILISPRARPGLQDDTPYTHYSTLRTISEAWDLPLLGHAGDPSTAAITRPWK
ncbi:MAG: alkaline phosphatase family protein [Bacteroidota bacterium]